MDTVESCFLELFLNTVSQYSVLVLVLSLCDEIMAVDNRIRFVAHLDEKGALVEMKMRPGVNSLTAENTDERLFGFIEPCIMGICNDLEKDFGKIKTVRLKFNKVSVIFLRIPNAFVGISMEPGSTTPVVEKIAAKYGTNLT